MKIQAEIDLEGFHDGDTEYGGDSIESAIINAITAKVEKQINVKEKMEAIIQEKMEKSLNELIDTCGEKFLEEYFDKEITVTNDYGDTKFKGTLREKIQSQFDEMMGEKVDGKGNPYDSRGYGSDGGPFSRIDFFTKKILDDKMATFTKDTVKQVLQQVETKLKDELKTAIGKGVVDSIGVNKLISNMQNN